MQVQIANIKLRISPDGLNWPDETFPLFQNFIGQISAYDDWHLESVAQALPSTVNKKVLFDSGGSWAAFAGDTSDDLWLGQYTEIDGEKNLQSLLHVNNVLKKATLYGQSTASWGYPLDELLFLNAFSLNSTLLLHSCLYEYRGRGYLFCGVSGAGKSTLGKLLMDASLGGQVLCDERNTITITSDGRTIVSSTPWYGTGNYCVAKSVPLASLLVLDPAHKGCQIETLTLTQSISELMRTVFLPQFRKDGIESSMATLGTLIEQTPVLKLSYDKSKTDIGAFLVSSVFSSQG